ncbi:MAG: DUF1156 domain-containing protein [Chloroflexi bacterium]|nr:DUF1156 domain-containing protein [Chloroflexota bacterium]
MGEERSQEPHSTLHLWWARRPLAGTGLWRIGPGPSLQTWPQPQERLRVPIMQAPRRCQSKNTSWKRSMYWSRKERLAHNGSRSIRSISKVMACWPEIGAAIRVHPGCCLGGSFNNRSFFMNPKKGGPDTDLL